jgi:hypothetical protein
VHDIARADDPNKGLQTRENLLARCQQCHPGATANFPDSWMSHYIPSAEKYPIVYYVNLFYKFFIPAVLGPMVLLVVMDFGRMMINRFRKPKPVAAAEVPAETAVESEQKTEPAVEPDLEAESAPLEEVSQPEQTEEAPVAETEPEPAEAPSMAEAEVQPQAAEEPDQPEADPEQPVESKPSDDEEKSNDR